MPIKIVHRDICVILCMFAYVFLGFGFVVLEESASTVIQEVQEQIVEQEVQQVAENYSKVYIHHEVFRFILDTTSVSYTVESDIDEYNCVMYATVPIGRYYITAYNHEETGSKKTASGAICHEGTITTCAADVWGGYFKFGDYIEVDGRIYKVEDTGSAVKKKHIDLYFASYKAMARYGSNYQTIYRVEFPFGKPEEK